MADVPAPLAPPPHYAAATAIASSSAPSPSASVNGLDTFFDIVPQADQTSFQVGYLGLNGFRAWIKGDVLVKLDGRASADALTYSRCSITLEAIETDRDQSITIFSEKQVLWSSIDDVLANSGGDTSARRVPTTLPFSFSLTSDLPHCIHLSTSSLSYRLEATLATADKAKAPDVVRSTPVHLTRYSRPGPLVSGEAEQSTSSLMLEPHTWSIERPSAMLVQLQRTLFRRAEPISVLIRIPPPEGKLLSLSLRSVEANLVRVITAKSTGEKHELLLAHSGKLCRFHSTRTIVLRLRLHPPFDASNMPYPHPDHDAAQGGPINGRGGGGGCESVTQTTLLHDVSFCIRINVAIRSTDGERHDVTLERNVTILPGAAGHVDVTDAGRLPSDAVPKHSKMDKEWEQQSSGSRLQVYDGGPSTSSASAAYVQPVIDEMEEEYDGYEDVGRPLSDTDERIDARGMLFNEQEDDDAPPPTLLESRHDLQVEVDVAGVGAGVLREDPPPALPNDYVWRSDDPEHASLHDNNDPPPPSSPAPHDLFERVANSSTHSTEREVFHAAEEERATGTNEGHRPPPYMASSSLRSRQSVSGGEDAPSRTSSMDTSGTLLSLRSARPLEESSGLQQLPTQLQSPRGIVAAAPPPPHSPATLPAPQQQSAITLDEPLPPAYTRPNTLSFNISPHPPSYEA